MLAAVYCKLFPTLPFSGFGNTRVITGTMKSCNTHIIYDLNRNHPNTANNKNSFSIISSNQENAPILDLRNQEL